MQELKLEPKPKPTLKLRLSPGLKVSLEILQKPVLELKSFVAQILAENPFLESDDDGVHEISLEQLSQDAADQEEIGLEEETDRTDLASRQAKKDYQLSLISQPTSLQEELIRQLGLHVSSQDLAIGEEIIGNIAPDGYLVTPTSEIAGSLGVSEGDVERVLKVIQSLEPQGVGARSLGECLLIQLKAKARSRAGATLAWKIVSECFDELAKRQFKKIAGRLKTSLEAVREAAREIAGLNPKPGRLVGKSVVTSIVPDVTIQCRGPQVEIDCWDGYLPRLKIQKEYEKLLRGKKKTDALTPELKLKYKEAIWLVKALEAREKTLQKITRALVEIQEDFFKEGPPYLKPLTAKELASRVHLAESTVSRAIADKYIATPFGIFAMKDLFSRKALTVEEEPLFNDELKTRIHALIAQEDPNRPYSDREIAQRLQQQNAPIARRTVAKYRDKLGLLPARLRRK